MSYDEYVHHIAQKYRLAIAISVIKSKPDNLSIEEYLLQLQTKISDQEIDPNETICSDDFNFNDPCENNQTNTQTDISKNDTGNGNIGNRLEISGNENDSEGSQTILNDFVFGDDLECNRVQRESDFEETIHLLKEVTTDIPEKHITDQNLSQTTFCESQEAIHNTDNDITYCTNMITIPHNIIETNGRIIQNVNVDSQETQLYTLYGFTQNYTHVSQTQGVYFEIPDKYVRNKTSNKIQDSLEDIDENAEPDIISNVNNNVTTTNEFANEDVRNSTYKVNAEINLSNIQYPNEDDVIAFSNIRDVTDIEKVTQNVKYVENANLAQTFQFNIYNRNDPTSSKEAIRERDCTTVTSDFNDTPFVLFDIQNIPKESNAVNSEMQNLEEHKQYSLQYSQQIEADIPMDNDNITIQKPTEYSIDTAYRMEVESESDEDFEERVPFKVLEELNRVKSFLNRRDRRNDGGYSTDSGYRSDSKSRSLMSSSQLSGTSGAWLNQSAHCLFNHILQTSAADDITKEITQVLGQLIDKLHEEENYPPFLEELLETVDQILKDMHEGQTENALLTKDENIYHLMLLNKSKHILQYTIDKINTILQELHTNLTKENLYELSNIIKVENVCYIFHILEVLLKRYVKVKDVVSQSTQNSQECPKRSSLTELWRKKWSLNAKEVIKNENKTCVLKSCHELLNKIIVECMEGYSLVAFAALQCFNLIQV